MAAAAFVPSVSTLRRAMEIMTSMPDLPNGERRRIVVEALPVPHAAPLVLALHMKSAINLTAIQEMANAHDLLVILGTATLSARADNPHHRELLDWVAQCQEMLRQSAARVGGTFQDTAIPLCREIWHHVLSSGTQTRAWIVSNAKALAREATKLSKDIHTLSQVDDQDEANDGEGAN